MLYDICRTTLFPLSVWSLRPRLLIVGVRTNCTIADLQPPPTPAQLSSIHLQHASATRHAGSDMSVAKLEKKPLLRCGRQHEAGVSIVQQKIGQETFSERTCHPHELNLLHCLYTVIQTQLLVAVWCVCPRLQVVGVSTNCLAADLRLLPVPASCFRS